MLIKDKRFSRPSHVPVHSPLRPYLQVRYINPHSGIAFKAHALIDTGADTCCLPKNFADILGHNYDKGESVDIKGANGASYAYKHTMQMEIPGFITEQVMVAFVENLTVPLVGVSTFLCNFTLNIDYPKQRFSLHHEEKISPSDWPN